MSNETVLLIMAACVVLLTLKVAKPIKRYRYNKHLSSAGGVTVEYNGITTDRLRSQGFNVEWYADKNGDFKHF